MASLCAPMQTSPAWTDLPTDSQHPPHPRGDHSWCPEVGFGWLKNLACLKEVPKQWDAGTRLCQLRELARMLERGNQPRPD